MKRYKLTRQPVEINLNKLSSSLLFMVRSCSAVMVTFSKDKRKLVEYIIQKDKVSFYSFSTFRPFFNKWSQQTGVNARTGSSILVEVFEDPTFLNSWELPPFLTP